jgi:hypothetical protein
LPPGGVGRATAHEIIIFRYMPSPNAATEDIEQAIDLSPVQLVYLNWLRVNVRHSTTAVAIQARKENASD